MAEFWESGREWYRRYRSYMPRKNLFSFLKEQGFIYRVDRHDVDSDTAMFKWLREDGIPGKFTVISLAHRVTLTFFFTEERAALMFKLRWC